ncbi:uncharacterized protein Triagg1_4347 [Trichoderma aggressivum f. europaeum]|uniref:FAD-binding PCMH-type domain-containing protein n=1 Tax=Trichoderma aggressivum f. europaeum TaxID=173218 RepID=A0AAE1J8D2_9HYPO|nr:hypothetical protein Triagg1_4347 [Trichoderma aggressivum f. europaeum]
MTWPPPFLFSKKHNIRVEIKNTGHDYFGRGASANSLAMRTNNMKNMTSEPVFKTDNCPPANKKNIGIIGAGVNAAQVIGFFSKHGMSVTTGACPTVGIAGGFGLGGGHGPLAPTHGLMVDQAVEFGVVTTDGVFRTINQCNEPDLFWAMRGGGATLSPDSPDITSNTVLREILIFVSNEQHVAEPEWKNVFFGEPYEKLLAIKKKWDPDTVLNCVKCIVYLWEQDLMYSCDSKDPFPSVPYSFGQAESDIMSDGNVLVDVQKGP